VLAPCHPAVNVVVFLFFGMVRFGVTKKLHRKLWLRAYAHAGTGLFRPQWPSLKITMA
jgi:hypothetical protein